MSEIICVHGMGQQVLGEDSLLRDWVPALRDGVRRAGGEPPAAEMVAMAFYGDLFRRKGTKPLGIPPYDATDLAEEWERALLDAWWCEAARVEPEVPGPEAATKVRTPRGVQRALSALSRSRFFAGIALRAFIADLKQVRAYLHDEEVRRACVERLESAVAPTTRVIVAHSLGTIIAYEALAAHPEWRVRAFVTLGSPLGIRNLIFERLRPAPEDGVGVWPGGVSSWTNVADGGDVVALGKELAPRFGGEVEDRLIHNGAKAHDARTYLTAKETGEAIARGLDG